MISLEQQVQKIKSDNPYDPIYIYGAGNLGIHAAWFLEKLDIRVTAFLDHDSRKNAVAGIPVYLPDEILSDSTDKVIFITAGAMRAREILRNIEIASRNPDRTLI